MFIIVPSFSSQRWSYFTVTLSPP